MTIEHAIKKAIEKGWVQKPNTAISGNWMPIGREKEWKKLSANLLLLGILDDPSFWQSLGKALGWGQQQKVWRCKKCGRTTLYHSHHDPEFCTYDGKRPEVVETPDYLNQWKTNWHYFIDHLADGESPEDFFKKL